MAMTAALYAITTRTYALFLAVSENTVRLGITEHHYHDAGTPCTHYTPGINPMREVLEPITHST